jgi:hypothetical protein
MNNEKINKRIQKRFVNYNEKTKSNNFFNIEMELTNRNIIFENSNEYKRNNKINTDIVDKNISIPKRPKETILKNDNYYINRIEKDEQSKFSKNFYKYQAIPKKTKFPDMGINMPNMITGYNYNILSNNTVDIENNLTNRNLILTNCDETKKKENVKPSIKNINMIEFFKKNKTVYIPEPLVIEQCQRPKGPFCQQ